MKRKLSVRRWASVPVVVIGVAVSALVLGISPADAAQGGGGGTGLFKYTVPTPTNAIPPCGRFDTLTFDSTVYNGAYVGLGGNAYAGGLRVHLQSAEVFYANPVGLFSNDTCTSPKPTVRVSGTTNSALPVLAGTNVACTWVDSTTAGQGSTFSRVGQNYVFSLVGTCSVNNVTESPLKTREIHQGALTTCRGGPPPNECDAVETYQAVTSAI